MRRWWPVPCLRNSLKECTDIRKVTILSSKSGLSKHCVYFSVFYFMHCGISFENCLNDTIQGSVILRVKHFEESGRDVRINATATLPSKTTPWFPPMASSLSSSSPYALFWRRLFLEPADNVPSLQGAVVTSCFHYHDRQFASKPSKLLFSPLICYISSYLTFLSPPGFACAALQHHDTCAHVTLVVPETCYSSSGQRKRQVCEVHDIWRKDSSCAPSK